MRGEQIHGHWRELKGFVLENWGRLTGNPWLRIAGRRERLCGGLEASLAHSRRVALAPFTSHRSRRLGRR